MLSRSTSFENNDAKKKKTIDSTRPIGTPNKKMYIVRGVTKPIFLSNLFSLRGSF